MVVQMIIKKLIVELVLTVFDTYSFFSLRKNVPGNQNDLKKFISFSSLDVSCSPWSEGNGCVGEGRPGDHGHIMNWGEWRDWVVLDDGMENSDYANCERLCKSYRENGCCYLKTGLGCYWRPGGYSIKSKNDNGAVSINCYRSGRNKIHLN